MGCEHDAGGFTCRLCLEWAGAGLLSVSGCLGIDVDLRSARILNFAHAALFMLAAYLAAQVSAWSGSFWVALLVAPPVLALVGAGLEQGPATPHL